MKNIKNRGQKIIHHLNIRVNNIYNHRTTFHLLKIIEMKKLTTGMIILIIIIKMKILIIILIIIIKMKIFIIILIIIIEMKMKRKTLLLNNNNNIFKN